MNDEHRLTQPSGFPSTITVTVNVVVSGGLVVEFKTTNVTDAADLKKLTDELSTSDTKLGVAVSTNPVPAP
jgi:hypothetical protein